ncbi:2-dehydropantoate 2-reductase [Haloferula luteola]|uniref:2-dehydropantoate 2-reductase n=1 Tax=Haloferula luteola TaxID=595692 RepID=A0A840UW41_9BACT|nr:2-dehydropantoate 2-reductase [Haloferula luteola]MBB5350002.1 2-dehydropantoate 2-reductase [Haloferula luteola]
MHLGGRIALVGAGAVGLYYGARLALQGEDVHFLLRSDYEAVKERGIVIESVDGDAVLEGAKVFRSPEEIGEVDWILVAWKATANDQFEEILRPMVGPNTQVVTLQNGLGNCERLAELFGAERVCGGLCFVCINRLGPGHVKHTAGGKVTLGEWVPEPGLPRAERLSEAFRQAGVVSTAVETLPAAQWRKLVWNFPFNGLAIAEGGVTTDVLLAQPEIEEEIAGLMREVMAVARAQGYAMEDSLVDFEIGRTRPMGPYRPSSMIDYVEGRPVEFEAIWGEPLRRALSLGVAVPRMEKLAARIREKLA